MSAIITTDLIKKYKTSFSLKKFLGKRDFIQETMALNGLSFSVDKGEIYDGFKKYLNELPEMVKFM
jgi:hypothetical protein